MILLSIWLTATVAASNVGMKLLTELTGFIDIHGRIKGSTAWTMNTQYLIQYIQIFLRAF